MLATDHLYHVLVQGTDEAQIRPVKEKLPDLSQQGQQKKLIKSQESKVLWLLCPVLISVAMLSHKEIPAFLKMHCYSFKPVSAGLLFLSISFSPLMPFFAASVFFPCRRSEARNQNFFIRQSPTTFPSALLLAPLLPSNPISTAA